MVKIWSQKQTAAFTNLDKSNTLTREIQDLAAECRLEQNDNTYGSGSRVKGQYAGRQSEKGRHNETPAAGMAYPGGRAALDGATRMTLARDSSGDTRCWLPSRRGRQYEAV